MKFLKQYIKKEKKWAKTVIDKEAEWEQNWEKLRKQRR